MYQNAIEKYPAKHGDVWVAPTGTNTAFSGTSHAKGVTRLICQNFFEADIQGPFDFIYTDPPWNQAILNKFYRAAKKEPPNFKEYLHAFLTRCASLTGGLICIDMGVPGTPLVLEIAQALGLHALGVSPMRYGKNIACNLIVLSHQTQAPIRLPTTYAMEEVRQMIAGPLSGYRTMLEPCAGEGYFVEIALQAGMQVTATEIIPEKYASMLRRINRITPLEKEATTS